MEIRINRPRDWRRRRRDLRSGAGGDRHLYHWRSAALGGGRGGGAGLNLFLGGHYATETFGVKALAAELAEKFGVPWEFLHHPTGL